MPIEGTKDLVYKDVLTAQDVYVSVREFVTRELGYLGPVDLYLDYVRFQDSFYGVTLTVRWVRRHPDGQGLRFVGPTWRYV